eukprot:7391868-Prymnesium_polylepis.1
MCAGPCGRLVPEPPATALVHRTPCPTPPSHPSPSLTHPAPALLRVTVPRPSPPPLPPPSLPRRRCPRFRLRAASAQGPRWSSPAAAAVAGSSDELGGRRNFPRGLWPDDGRSRVARPSDLSPR